MVIGLNRLPPADARDDAIRGTYSIHPLAALDGVVLYVTLDGEAVGSWFGATEELAAEAFARHLTGVAAHPSGRRSS